MGGAKMKKGLFRKITIFVIMTGLIFTASFYLYKKDRQETRTAVFLSTGQVYFGKLVRVNKENIVLKDIYYLSDTKDLSANDGKKISIVKLGEELHGPKDLMYIQRTHILFYEEMRSDSKINEAIGKYLGKK
jgi:hypothetical protein